MADDRIHFVLGFTDLRALADEHGFTYEQSADGLSERVLRPDGTAVVDVRYPPKQPRKKDAPSVWMRSIRFHTYDGHPQEEASVYLAREADVDNIVTQRFAIREAPPRRAVRSPESQPVAPVATGTEPMTADNTPALTPTRRRPQSKP